MSRIVLGVAGGVAAYKAALLVRAFTESGHDVRVVPTPSALHFVGAATFEALSGNPVTTDVWSDVDEVAHVRIGQTADLVVVAPATADLLARAAAGRADDLLTPGGSTDYSLDAFRAAFAVQYVFWAIGLVGVVRHRRQLRARLARDGVVLAPLVVAVGARLRGRSAYR